MDAREYLEQIKDLDGLIEDLNTEVEEKEERAMRVTRRVWTYAIPSKEKEEMADAVVEYVDIERGELRGLVQKRQEIIDTMRLLPSKQFGVLYRRYVLGREFYEIAIAYDRSESWVKSMIRTALDNLQKILDEREKNESVLR